MAHRYASGACRIKPLCAKEWREAEQKQNTTTACLTHCHKATASTYNVVLILNFPIPIESSIQVGVREAREIHSSG